ncbi:TrkA family potassium uptake protein [Arthrobacter gandavensis]|uniref:TrkA family potassium uptake protein n=1 Tax=Arthrobacter gandavensis TaxID=169960 RepID=A0ABN2NUL0_9MICC|nr:TrkA family potassium uptake protein [Arthrobacter citreus]
MAKLNLFNGREAERISESDAVAVIGLGRFGQSLALELMANGVDVLGVDGDQQVVQGLDGRLTYVVMADATREDVLRQLSIPEFNRVVVAIGQDIGASILAVSLLLRFGVPEIWAEAVSEAHGTVLEQLGVHHVIFPEKDMGRRVAHLVQGSLLDYIPLGGNFAVIETAPREFLAGSTIYQSQVRRRFGVVIVAVRKSDGEWQFAEPDLQIDEGDELLVAGPTKKAEAFSRR